jgi:hypothetical protein
MDQLNEMLATWKALRGVGSPKEAIELQMALARTAFHSSVEATGKITEASMRLMEQAMAARMAVASKTLTNAIKDRHSN